MVDAQTHTKKTGVTDAGEQKQGRRQMGTRQLCIRMQAAGTPSPPWRPWLPARESHRRGPTCPRTRGKTSRNRISRSTTCTEIATCAAQQKTRDRVEICIGQNYGGGELQQFSRRLRGSGGVSRVHQWPSVLRNPVLLFETTTTVQ